jgi:hypothetical protein
LGYLRLEAPREYVQHGPLLSINWLRLCPQFGARIRSRAVRRRLFIVLMTAAHISPNVFSLRNFLSNIHGLFLTIHSTSFIPIIHHIYMNNYLFYLHNKSTLLFLRVFVAGRLPSVSCVRYMYNPPNCRRHSVDYKLLYSELHTIINPPSYRFLPLN